MKKILLLCCALSIWTVMPAQVYKASLGKDGAVQVTKISDHGNIPAKAPLIDQLPGWPVKIAAHPNFKNMRGVTIADIDNDGVNEVLAASYNTLYAFKADGSLLWSKQLTGTAIYPPTVADMNLDGQLKLPRPPEGCRPTDVSTLWIIMEMIFRAGPRISIRTGFYVPPQWLM